MQAGRLTEALKLQARQMGFSLVGVCPAGTPPHWEAFQKWLQAGCAGQMDYFHRRASAYAHPHFVLEGSRSLVMLGMNYRTEAPVEPGPGQARIARYAWGMDYHELIRCRLRRLARWLLEQAPGARVRGVVDTAPLLERSFAQQAGLGWIGKNTLLIHPQWGSYLFLAALLTDLELDYDDPFDRRHCGRCRACLDACPTGALTAPYVLDARRCISYLTIELRQMPPKELRPKIGDWLFGCDRCQEVCPWNRRPVVSEEPAFRPMPGHNPANAVEILSLTEEAFHQRFRQTPLRRPRRAGLLRSAALVLGNRPCAEGLAVLRRGLQDSEPLVRAACAWALGRYHDPAASSALERAFAHEPDEEVRQEIISALRGE